MKKAVKKLVSFVVCCTMISQMSISAFAREYNWRDYSEHTKKEYGATSYVDDSSKIHYDTPHWITRKKDTYESEGIAYVTYKSGKQNGYTYSIGHNKLQYKIRCFGSGSPTFSIDTSGPQVSSNTSDSELVFCTTSLQRINYAFDITQWSISDVRQTVNATYTIKRNNKAYASGNNYSSFSM